MRLVKLITFSRFTVLVALMVAGGSRLSAQENSPYSRYGLGDMVPSANIINRAMGGVSTGYFDYQSINYLNPATYSKLRVTTFDLGFQIDNRTLREPGKTDKYNSASTNISYVQLGIPLVPKRQWGLVFGLRPVTRVNYKILTTSRNAIDSLATIYEGTGGSYRVFTGTGIAIKNLSLGVNIGYTFGTKAYSTRTSFLNDSISYMQSNYETKSTFGGFTFEGGALYSIKLHEDKDHNKTSLRLGVSGQLQRKLNANQDKLRETFEYDVNGGTFPIDTISSTTGESGSVTYPSTLNAGFTFEKENNWLVGMDFTSSNWSKYQFFGQTDAIQNSWQLRTGGQWTPDVLRGKSYWSHVTYRMGFYFGRDYIKADQHNLPIVGITGGAAFPIRRANYTNQFTVINTAIEVGRRGNKQNTIQENFFRIAVGLSLSDLWFIKRKYE